MIDIPEAEELFLFEAAAEAQADASLGLPCLPLLDAEDAVSLEVNPLAYWQGPQMTWPEPSPHSPVSPKAILARKAGDRPAFWKQPGSFLAWMEELHRQSSQSCQ